MPEMNDVCSPQPLRMERGGCANTALLIHFYRSSKPSRAHLPKRATLWLIGVVNGVLISVRCVLRCKGQGLTFWCLCVDKTSPAHGCMSLLVKQCYLQQACALIAAACGCGFVYMQLWNPALKTLGCAIIAGWKKTFIKWFLICKPNATVCKLLCSG